MSRCPLPRDVPNPKALARSTPTHSVLIRSVLPVACALSACVVLSSAPVMGQDAQTEPPTRAWLEAIQIPEIEFTPPEAVEHTLSNGVTVFHLKDDAFPVIDMVAHFRGGFSYLPREFYAAGTALPTMLRTGGSSTMSPDAIDEFFEARAVQTTFGGSGESIISSISVLVEHLDETLEVWGAMLKTPAFDAERIAIWRGQEVESLRRRIDNPAGLAFSEYNRLMYGDHPIGWEMTEADIAEERVTPEVFNRLHAQVLCADNLLFGVVGPLEWVELEPRLEGLMADWPACEQPLELPPIPDVGAPPGVYLIPRPLNQSTVVVAHPTDLRQSAEPEYFSAQLGNTILGASGLTSRMSQVLRTERGYAYGASSLWTTPRRYPGLVGATTQTRSETTIQAIRAMIEVMEGMADRPPTEDELQDRIDEAVNGWVFNFQTPARIVSRRLGLRAARLPDDWLTRYLDGIRAVTPEAVRAVYDRYLRPGEWVILIVGNPDDFEGSLDGLGPITILDPDAGNEAPE